MLTTHPYPYFVEHVFRDEYVSLRTTMHASCETKYYSDLGGKPCLMEEIGTLGPMLCDDETAAKFARVNLFSGWANGSKGLMWWCANDQTNLRTIPYTRCMAETELGFVTVDGKPKPVLTEFKKISEFIEGLDFTFPKATEDAVCIVSQSQDQWGIAYMSHILAKQAGMNLRYAYIKDDIPKADVYMLPSVSGGKILPFEQLEIIRNRVEDGATLYVSNECLIREFEQLFGSTINMAVRRNDSNSLTLKGEKIHFTRSAAYRITPTHAEVLANDEQGNPAITRASYGKGSVYFVNFPLEQMLLDEDNAFEKNRYKIYSEIFKEVIASHPVVCENPNLALTLHSDDEYLYCIIINHTNNTEKIQLNVNASFCIENVIYGSAETVDGFDASVIKFKKLSNLISLKHG